MRACATTLGARDERRDEVPTRSQHDASGAATGASERAERPAAGSRHAQRPESSPGLSIVLPCHDEAPNVRRAVDEATRAAERVAEAHEILVVDDGSRDGTRGVAELCSAEDSRVRVLVHQRNHGYGAALRTGIGAARLAWVFVTDADLQFDMRELEQFLPFAVDHDLIAGYRIARADRLHRRANAAAWNALVHVLFDIKVRDVDCAFKLMRRDVVQRFELASDGATISTELIAKAQCTRARGSRSWVCTTARAWPERRPERTPVWCSERSASCGWCGPSCGRSRRPAHCRRRPARGRPRDPLPRFHPVGVDRHERNH